MNNQVKGSTVRDFVMDMQAHYNQFIAEGKSVAEVYDIAFKFFTGLTNGSILINLEKEKADVIKEFAGSLLDKLKKLKAEGVNAGNTLTIARIYFSGLIDGIDVCMEPGE